jgi:SpoVK/Ycf46/Vps4 family AAA+-type ATPase
MKLAEEVDLDEVAGKTDGMSGAELESVCSNAGRNALLRVLETKEAPSVRRIDFEGALEERRAMQEKPPTVVGFRGP